MEQAEEGTGGRATWTLPSGSVKLGQHPVWSWQGKHSTGGVNTEPSLEVCTASMQPGAGRGLQRKPTWSLPSGSRNTLQLGQHTSGAGGGAGHRGSQHKAFPQCRGSKHRCFCIHCMLPGPLALACPSCALAPGHHMMQQRVTVSRASMPLTQQLAIPHTVIYCTLQPPGILDWATDPERRLSVGFPCASPTSSRLHAGQARAARTQRKASMLAPPAPTTSSGLCVGQDRAFFFDPEGSLCVGFPTTPPVLGWVLAEPGLYRP